MSFQTVGSSRGYVWGCLAGAYVLARVGVGLGVLGFAVALSASDRAGLAMLLAVATVVGGLLLLARRLGLAAEWAAPVAVYEKIVPGPAAWFSFVLDMVLVITFSKALVAGGHFLPVFPGAYVAKLAALLFLVMHVAKALQKRRSGDLARIFAAAGVSVACWAIADAVVPLAWRAEQAGAVLGTVGALGVFLASGAMGRRWFVARRARFSEF